MGTINYVGSLRYDMHGRKRRTKSLNKPKPLKTKGVSVHTELMDEKIKEHRIKYPSSNSMNGSTAKKEQQVYTGDLIVGIATMHKSNAVPVMNKQQAKDISRMGK